MKNEERIESRILDAARAAIEFLESLRIPYVVIGGIANAVWGDPRATRDADFKVFIGNRTLSQFEELLANQFPLVAPDSPEASPLIFMARAPNRIKLDFLIAVPGYEDEVLRRASRHAFGDLTFPICSAEDLVIQKVIADRDKDWMDLASLINIRHDELDDAYIRNWLSQFAEILERPDWLERYDSLVIRATEHGSD